VRKLLWEKYSSRKKSDDDDDDLGKDYPIKALLEKNLKFPEDDFNLWMLHTNFHIMEIDVENIEFIDGVECLDVWSPYSLRIGIGRLFDEEKVKADISFILNSSESLQILTEETKKEVEEMLESFKDTKYWAILILPNGKIVTYTSKEEKDFKEKLEFFEKIQAETTCQLLTS